MWHISDGDLNAYLDGALSLYPVEEADRIREHLERCEECRRRLRDEETVRDRAGEVLAETAPATEEPFRGVSRPTFPRAAIPPMIGRGTSSTSSRGTRRDAASSPSS